MLRLLLTASLLVAVLALPNSVLVASAKEPVDTAPSFAGESAPCPVGTKEVAIVPYAKDDVDCGFCPSNCATVVTVMNLDKSAASVTVQFFYGSGIGPQAGSDATLSVNPGRSENIGTRGSDPLFIYSMNADAGGPTFEGLARVCSDKKKLAIEASLICNPAGGPAMKDLKVVIRKQKGD